MQNICIGSRDNNNLSLNRDCSTVLEKQPISLINITDYAFASLDKECNSIKNRACGNYNYLSGLSLSTWT